MKRTIGALFILCVAISGIWILINNNQHTDLLEENIDTLYIGKDVTEPIKAGQFIQSRDVSHPGFDMYEVKNRVYMSVTVKKEAAKQTLYRIATSNPQSHTSKGVSIGSTIEECIEKYGKHYIKKQSDQADYIIKYKDKSNHLTLLFYIYKNKVDHISLQFSELQ